MLGPVPPPDRTCAFRRTDAAAEHACDETHAIGRNVARTSRARDECDETRAGDRGDRGARRPSMRGCDDRAARRGGDRRDAAWRTVWRRPADAAAPRRVPRGPDRGPVRPRDGGDPRDRRRPEPPLGRGGLGLPPTARRRRARHGRHGRSRAGIRVHRSASLNAAVHLGLPPHHAAQDAARPRARCSPSTTSTARSRRRVIRGLASPTRAHHAARRSGARRCSSRG